MKQAIGIIAVMMVLIMAFTGCAFLRSAQRVIDEQNFAFKTGVQYATLKLISQSSDVTASGVLSVTDRLKGYVQDDPAVTLESLKEEAKAMVPWQNFDLADQILIHNVFDFIQAYLADLVGEGVLADGDKVTVLTVIRWVEEAAALAVADARLPGFVADLDRFMWGRNRLPVDQVAVYLTIFSPQKPA